MTSFFQFSLGVESLRQGFLYCRLQNFRHHLISFRIRVQTIGGITVFQPPLLVHESAEIVRVDRVDFHENNHAGFRKNETGIALWQSTNNHLATPETKESVLTGCGGTQSMRFAGNVAQAEDLKEDELAGAIADLYYQAH
jgi:hypothetical protein